MKLTVVLMLAATLQISASGYSQPVTLTLKNVSLQKLFREINRQTGYDFFFKDDLLNKAGKVNIDVKGRPVEEVLSVCFSNLPLTYSIMDKTIIVKERSNTTVTATEEELPALTPIKGRVVDNAGQPLAGATITLKGTNTAVVSDAGGNFNIDVKAGQVLVITYVGYARAEYMVGSATSITITLYQKQAELTSVMVVSTGYQQLPKERSAGSYSTVTNEAIKNKSVSMNILDRVEGLVPGLAVNNSKNAEKFLMRGLTSINADKAPLVVVDGVPIYNTGTLTSLINPDDVETVNFLRDATAASIWGAAAANGVIVITTKKGKFTDVPKKIQVNYNGFVSFRGKPDVDYYNPMYSGQLVQAGREVFDIVANPWAVVSTSASNNSRPVITPHEQILYDQARGLISAQVAGHRFDSLSSLNNKTQLSNFLYQPSMLTNHSLNFNGGSMFHNYYGSLAYTRDAGVNKTNLDRYQLNLRQDFVFSSKIKLDLTTNIAYEKSKKFLVTDFPGTANTMLPYAMLKDNAGNPLSMAYLLRHDPFRATSEAQSQINLNYIPFQEPNYTKNSTTGFSARVNAGLSVKLFKGLTYEGRAQYQRTSSDAFEYYDQNSYRVRNERVYFTQAPTVVGGNPTYYLPTTGGHYLTSNGKQTAWTVRNQLLYDNTFRKKHQLTMLAGTEVRGDFFQSLGTFKRGYDFQTMTYSFIDEQFLGATGVTNPVNFLPSKTVNTLDVKQQTYGETERRFFSLYGNAAYSYNRRYTLNASIRMDQSNLFGSDPSVQYRPVWSVGGAWNIGNEDFFRSKWVNSLKLRATYGLSGNAPSPGQAGPFDIIRGSTSAIYSGLGTGYIILTPKNDRLTWERTTTTNLGVDFGLWNNDLSGSIDLYDKKTQDLLGFIPIDPTTGFSFAYDNLGSLRNKGIEIQLNSNNLKTKNFRWRTIFTISYNKNKISLLKRQTALTASNKISGSQMEGYSAYPIFGYNYIGLDVNGNPMALSATNDTLRLANQIKVDDPVYAGTTQPLWYGGMTNIFSYKSVSLSFLMIYNMGHQMRSDVNRFYTGRLTGNIPVYFNDRWKTAGDELRTDVPRYIANTANSSSQRNTAFYTNALQKVVSASYIKLRDITLSYDLNKDLLKKLSMSDLSVYAQVNNIMVWTKNGQLIDPEYYDLQQGARTDRMPAFYTIGIKASFK